jgi:alkanesulfonate monooxygenase SsuD/methylene tetrahydromethanopterin reductase-like flavin-dependent oxidoreductase (luciferase family)
MRSVEIGLVLPMGESFVDGSTVRWAEIRDLAVRAEVLGFDCVWVPDELLWRQPDQRTRASSRSSSGHPRAPRSTRWRR